MHTIMMILPSLRLPSLPPPQKKPSLERSAISNSEFLVRVAFVDLS